MQVRRLKSFTKWFDKLDYKIQHKVLVALELFMLEPTHSLLRNHALRWTLSWFRSINVTWDVRIIFRELSDGTYELVELVQVGTHSQLYG